MFIKSLTLSNFRNYEYLQYEPGERVNILHGFNAQGKTNLLEAIFCLATGHSHRSKDIDLVRWGTHYFQIRGSVGYQKNQKKLEIMYEKEGLKNLICEGIRQQKLPEYLGNLAVVIFSPEDLTIIKGGPKERRRFLDFEISQISKTYAYLLIQYLKIIGQRNSLLKSLRNGQNNLNQLDVWDVQLVDLGSKILKKRFEMVKKLAVYTKAKHLQITAGKEQLEIKYYCSLQVRPDFSIEEIKTIFYENLKKIRNDELNRGISLLGPHRDDLILYINGIDLRQFGSQGQQRTAALSLKLAELELINNEKGEYPILLLDDVFSELDSLRRHYLLATVKQKIQTFITTTNLDYLDELVLKEAAVFRIEEGKLG